MNFDLASLKQYRWKNRLIVVMTGNKDNEYYLRFLHDYEKHTRDMVERKVVRKTIYNAKLRPQFQIVIYTLDAKFHRKLLKYGEWEDFLKVIDQMPLRKSEIRKHIKTIRV